MQWMDKELWVITTAWPPLTADPNRPPPSMCPWLSAAGEKSLSQGAQIDSDVQGTPLSSHSEDRPSRFPEGKAPLHPPGASPASVTMHHGGPVPAPLKALPLPTLFSGRAVNCSLRSFSQSCAPTVVVCSVFQHPCWLLSRAPHCQSGRCPHATSLRIARPTGHCWSSLDLSASFTAKLFLLAETLALQVPRTLCSHGFLLPHGCAGSSPLLTSLPLPVSPCWLVGGSAQGPPLCPKSQSPGRFGCTPPPQTFPSGSQPLGVPGHPKCNRPQPKSAFPSADQQVSPCQ